tara:strand:- start:8678 stop:10294 length:1617 start_codon:yes stop_codon:yes gene_type:complete
MPDYRLNSRSPYYIEGAIPVTEATPPTPVQNNTPPTVTITASNENPFVGETVTLDAVATDSDGTIAGYQWSTGGTTTQVQATSSSAACIDFYVVVTDNDGDTANATKRICWQKVPEIIENDELSVNCGDTVNEGAFSGQKVYNILDVGDKIGNVKIAFKDFSSDIYANSLLREIPVKFDLEWNATTQTTGYIGSSDYDSDLTSNGVDSSNISTASTSNKDFNTELTINKTAATPSQVRIIAETPLVNDRFSFTISCPNPTTLATPTHNYTLTATSSTADFQYNDSAGATQTVTLNQNTPTIVIAQKDSVSATSGTGTFVEGSLGFANGTPELTIDLNTEFEFSVDASGSLNEKQNIINMINNELKDSFLTYYNNDVAKYQNQAYYNSFVGERFIKELSFAKKNSNSTKVVQFIYLDEAAQIYHGATASNTQTSAYSSDLLLLRNHLNAQTSYGNKMCVVFCLESTQITTGSGGFYSTFPAFSHFIDNVSSGTNGFDGANGLADRSEVIFVRNLFRNQSATYYHQKTIDALRNLGYKIT